MESPPVVKTSRPNVTGLISDEYQRNQLKDLQPLFLNTIIMCAASEF